MMLSSTYRFEIAQIDNKAWTISAVHLSGGETLQLVGLYKTRKAAETSLPRVAQAWMDEERGKEREL